MNAGMKGPITSADCRKHIEEILDMVGERPGIKGAVLFYFECAVAAAKKDERKDVLNTLIERFSKVKELPGAENVAAAALCGAIH